MTLLRLILIRHAKSSWDNPADDDHARPLNDRGRGAAPRMGKWLADKGHLPDLVLCSDAARTVETLALMLPLWPTRPEVRYLDSLYHASAPALHDHLSGITSPRVAIVGHNPGIGMLATAFARHRPEHPRFSDYPTCATSVFGFDAARWSDVKPGTGHILDFGVPADVGG